MGRRTPPSEAVLTDSTNCAASAQTTVEKHTSQAKNTGNGVPVTFSRKAKVSAACDVPLLTCATVSVTADAVRCLHEVTSTGAVQSAPTLDGSTKENVEHTPQNCLRRAVAAETASPTLTDLLTPLSEAQSSSPEAILSAQPQQQHAVSSSRLHRLGSSEHEE